MENQTLLSFYLTVWPLYVCFLHFYAWEKHLSQIAVTLSHAAPSFVAITMTRIFVIGRGATVRQFVAGSSSGTNLWSLWVEFWPILLLVTFGAGVIQLPWLIAVVTKRDWRAWIPVPLSGTAMSAFAFMTVLMNFPDA